MSTDKPLQITVTEDHFRRGEKCIGGCPVALALREAGIADAVVNRWKRSWYIEIAGSARRRFPLPPEAKAVAVAFDHRRTKVQFPITFSFNPHGGFGMGQLQS